VSKRNSLGFRNPEEDNQRTTTQFRVLMNSGAGSQSKIHTEQKAPQVNPFHLYAIDNVHQLGKDRSPAVLSPQQAVELSKACPYWSRQKLHPRIWCDLAAPDLRMA
jgi:hypothetical protein